MPPHRVVQDREAVGALFIVRSTLYRRDDVRPLLARLGWWTLFAMLLVSTMLCLAAIFLEQRDAERLGEVIAAIPVQMVTQTDPLFRARLLWGGAAIGVLGQTINLLHTLVPSVPGVPIGVQCFQAERYPGNAAGPLPAWSFPFAYGLTFLLPTQLGFSCWFLMLPSRADLVAAAMASHTE